MVFYSSHLILEESKWHQYVQQLWFAGLEQIMDVSYCKLSLRKQKEYLLNWDKVTS